MRCVLEPTASWSGIAALFSTRTIVTWKRCWTTLLTGRNSFLSLTSALVKGGECSVLFLKGRFRAPLFRMQMHARTRNNELAPGISRVLHISPFRFGRRYHPGTWRTIVGLGRHFQNVVLCDRSLGYFPQEDPDDARLAAQAGIEVIADQSLSELSRPAEAASIARMLTRRYGPIQAIVGHLLGGIRALQVARHLDVPILSVFHGTDANLQLRAPRHTADFARLRSAPAAFFLAVSHNLVDRLIEFGMPPERTFLCHLGIDLDRYPVSERSETARPVKIVMAARFLRQKGHELAIRGFAEFVRRFPGASLDFIGSGRTPEQQQYGKELAALVDQIGLNSSIRFRAQMSVEALAQEFGHAEICLQTSVFIPELGQSEGLPNTILEAMATALPVVATRHSGIPEAVLHEQTGLLAEQHDIQGLAGALGRLAADAALRRRYGLAGRKHIEAEFNSVRQSERLAQRVREMIAAYGSISARDREAAWNA